MKRTRRRPPYNTKGDTNFPTRNVPGVYLIYTSTEAPVYVGFGAKDVYKALYRHFQQWDDPTHTRAVYAKRGGATVRVIYTRTASQAQRLEEALIVKHRPRDNPNKLKALEMNAGRAELVARAEDAPYMPTGEEAPF
jgi:hypothetical protein